MGAKHSASSRSESSNLSLNPNERRRLTAFLETKGSRSTFNLSYMENLWEHLLVPDLLHGYTQYLMKQASPNKSFIGIDEFVSIYSFLIRGDAEDKARAIAGVIGTKKDIVGEVVSFNCLCKYFSDLLDSYFLGLQFRGDVNYKSWTNMKHPDRQIMEKVMRSVCNDMPRQNDEVQLNDLERWLNYAGIISVLHAYVLGSLYDLEPEMKASIIPLAKLPTSKTPTFPDLSYIIYLNSFLPSDHKVKWRFLFSTLTHGESFSKLVGSISNEGPMILFVESDDNCIFGGFISENLAPGPRWTGNEDSFLFRLNPVVEVFPSTRYNDHYVYMNINQQSLPNGLGMGGQFSYFGLWIDSHFGKGECSESCTTYQNYKTLASNKKFRVNKLEVWGVGDPPLSPEEMGERRSDQNISILDKDAAASHILEMAGRKTYSRNLRGGSPDKELN